MADASVSKTDILTGVWVRIPLRAPVFLRTQKLTSMGEKVLKAIVVDDEKPARDELKFMLSEAGGVEVVAEAANAADAITALHEYACDVMFLDINMPDANGLNLAGALRTLHFPPCVVFVTAYSEYAVDAFGVKATDYLLKPVELNRLKEAISAVEKQVAVQSKEQRRQVVTCEKAGKRISVNANDILFAKARDDYAFIQTKDDSYFAPTSLSAIEKQLEGTGFMRIHRSYLVNLKKVEEVLSADGGSLGVKLGGYDEPLPVSRRKISVLKKTLAKQ